MTTSSGSFPKLHKAIHALLWELLWKNRVVFPALLVFLAVGAGLAVLFQHAPPGVWWGKYARGAAGFTFAGSILLAFAPFTLMDSHGSWRMNSVVTRWSVLPVPTFLLVAVPLAMAGILVSVLVWAWAPILGRLFAGIDMLHVLMVLLAGIVAAQALAWAIPRRPSQFWALAGLLFLLLLLGAILPQENQGWEDLRSGVFASLAAGTGGLALLALGAARRNRCGDWPGEIPLTALRDRMWRTGGRTGTCRHPVAALFWSEVAPGCRALVLGWVLLMVAVVVWAGVSSWLRRPEMPIDWQRIGLGMLLEGWANLAVLWLMGWGLYLACEPGLGFQTRLSGFRGTRPLTVGVLAGTRISAVVLGWLCLWVPLLVLQPSIAWMGLPEDDLIMLMQQASQITAGRMVFSAAMVIGALPLLLWGRLEGLPTLFLVTLVAWGWSWILGGFAYQNPPEEWLVWALAALLGARFLAAGGLLWRSHRQGYITWRFPAVLLGGWLAIAVGFQLLFTPWQAWGVVSALAPLVMIPLVRLAACPLAMGANRHG